MKLKIKYIINLIVYDNWSYIELNEIWEIINQIKGEKQPRMKRKQQTDLKNILAIGLGH